MNLEKKVAIVAGGTGGIGEAVARLLAANKAVVVLVSRNANQRAEIMNELRTQAPGSFSIEADLGTWKGWLKVVEEVCRRFQRVDILVHCVGILKTGKIDSLSQDEIEDTMTTNFGSVLYGMRTVIPVMKNQHSGHVITIGSLGGLVPLPFEAAYSGTKFAIRGLSLALSKELRGTGVRVSLVSPGAVKTRMLAAEAIDDNSDLAFYNKALPPYEVAKAVIDLLEKPKDEIMLPRWTTKIGLFLNFVTEGFSFLYPFFSFIGRIRRKALLKEIANSEVIYPEKS